MKEREALEILERDDDSMRKGYFCLNDFMALEVAKNALEKQIEKKPKMRHVKPYDNYNDGWCPCCGGYVQEEEYDTYYCQRCGQRLNWGVE